MDSVKENASTIYLRTHMDSADGWGHDEGERVRARLREHLRLYPGSEVFRVSLRDVRRTDSSFPRESVVALAKEFRGEIGFCLIDCNNPDVLDNWHAACEKRSQPLIAWLDGDKRLLGAKPSEGVVAVLDYLMSAISATTADIATTMGLSVSNASNKLKSLKDDGYVMRRERIAESGGVEFVYFVAR